MEKLPRSYTTPPAYKISVTQLQCTACGAETHAACSCGAVYRPKASERVAEYDKQSPGQSTRQAAADLGLSQSAVQKARGSGEHQCSPDPGASHDAPEPERVVGRDGKAYPATKPKQTYVSPVSTGKAAAADYHTADRVRNVLEYLVSEFDPLDLSRALCGCRDAKEIDRINRALERASKHLDDVRAARGNAAIKYRTI